VVEAASVGMRGQLPSRLGSLLPINIWFLNLESNAIEGPILESVGDRHSQHDIDESVEQLAERDDPDVPVPAEEPRAACTVQQLPNRRNSSVILCDYASRSTV